MIAKSYFYAKDVEFELNGFLVLIHLIKYNRHTTINIILGSYDQKDSLFMPSLFTICH